MTIKFFSFQHGRRLGLAMALFFLGGLWSVLSPFGVRADTLLLPDLDSLLETDETGVSPLMDVAADGDFNGDGRNDLCVVHQSYSPVWNLHAHLVFGGNFSRRDSLSARTRVLINLAQNGVQYYGKVKFADLNGDGRDDLLLGVYGSSSFNSAVYVYWGSSNPASVFNPAVTPADLTLLFGAKFTGLNICRGDFNGDGMEDVLLGDGGPSGLVYLFLGKSTFPSATVNLADGTSASRFFRLTGSWFGAALAAGDFNADGKDELVISETMADISGKTNAGRVHIFLGAQTFPVSWNVETTSAAITISGVNALGNLQATGAGDWSGDGIDDLIVFDGTANERTFFEGPALMAGPSQFAMVPGIPDYTAQVLPNAAGQYPTPMSDFDGDGRSDLFLIADARVDGFLSNDNTGDRTVPPAAVHYFTPTNMDLGDVNGDDRADLIVAPLGGPTGSLGIVYGYHPLDNPSVAVRSGGSPPPAIVVDVSVEGDPVDIKISGDIIDALRDQWVPFRPSFPLSLTSSSGSKSLSVQFRNVFGRLSPIAQTSLTLDPGSPRLEVITNDLGEETVARVDCHLDVRKRVKASVFDAAGTLLTTVLDRDLEAGVWPLTWDATNEGGNRVAPGIYYMSVEIDGRVEKKKVRVRPR